MHCDDGLGACDFGGMVYGDALRCGDTLRGFSSLGFGVGRTILLKK
jgi:hypothetical protein